MMLGRLSRVAVTRTALFHPPISPHRCHARRLLATSLHSAKSSPSHPPHPPPHLPRTCPNCHTTLPTPLPTCPACSTIRALPPDVDYFDLFGMERAKFEVDVRELRGRFLGMQRVCHPDAWGAKGETERQLAADQSSLINHAYRTLQSPLLRAQYILTQNGYSSLETDSLDETDSELLMEVLETREELESASSGDELEALQRDNSVRVNATLRELNEAFDAKDWTRAKEIAVRLRYWVGIEEAVAAKMRDG